MTVLVFDVGNEFDQMFKIVDQHQMKQKILLTIQDLCTDFLYYDRKEDEDLSMEQLQAAVQNGEITIDEMVSEFRKHLENSFK